MRLLLAGFFSFQILISGTAGIIRADEPSKLEELVAANTAAVERFDSLKVSITNRYRGYPDSDINYTYVFDGKRELWDIVPVKKETQDGEFTGLVYTLGRREVSNGPEGYRAVTNRDENRIESAEVLVDSPMTAVIEPQKSGIVELQAKCHLGLAVFQPEPRRQWLLAELYSECISSRIVATPAEPQSNGCWELEFVVPEGSHRVWLDPKYGHMISRSEWSGPKFKTAVDFPDFKSCGRDLFLASSFRMNQTGENNHQLELTGSITPESINKDLPLSATIVSLPEGIPFYDAAMGRSGIWGTDGPAVVFSNADESRKWDMERKLSSYAATNGPGARPESRRIWMMLTLPLLLLIMVSCLVYFRRHKKT